MESDQIASEFASVKTTLQFMQQSLAKLEGLPEQVGELHILMTTHTHPNLVTKAELGRLSNGVENGKKALGLAQKHEVTLGKITIALATSAGFGALASKLLDLLMKP